METLDLPIPSIDERALDAGDLAQHVMETQAATISAPSTAALALTDIKPNVLARFGDWRAPAAALVAKYEFVEFADLDTSKGYKALTSAIAEVRAPRFAAQAVDEAFPAEIKKLRTAVAAEKDAIVAYLASTEAALVAQRDAHDAKVAERARIEAARVATHQTNLAAIRDNAAKARGISSERIAKGIALVEAIAVDASWEEFEQPAAVAKAETLVAMRVLFDAAKATEDTAAAAEAERVRLARVAEEQRVERERLAAEDARQQAARDKLAADLKAFEAMQAAARQEQADREAAALKAIELDRQTVGQGASEPESAAPAHQEPEPEAQEALQVFGAVGVLGDADPAVLAWLGSLSEEDLRSEAPSIAHESPGVDIDAVHRRAEAPPAAAEVDTRPPINMTEINRRLGFLLSVDFIEDTLKLPYSHTERRATFWREADWPYIKAALVTHISALA